jgi:DNA-binding SARP family transcriptional activator
MLTSKLTPPGSAKAISRPRLCSKLKEITRKRLALVVAGAGYGKTTAIVQALESVDAGIVWYGLEESDGELDVFLSCLLTGFQMLDPGFSVGRQVLSPQVLQFPEGRNEALAGLLCALEDRVHSELVIVLDDFHLVRDHSAIVESLGFLMDRAPSNLHFIVASRTDPRLSSWKRAATRDVIEIWEAELSFTEEETAELLSEVFQWSAQDDQVRRIQRRTGGWPAALILAARAGAPARDGAALDMPREPDAQVFEYLEDHVFPSLSQDTQSFVLRASLLPSVEPALCNEVFRRNDADDKLLELCRDHLFISSSGTSFRFHQLFRDFLRDKLMREEGDEVIRALHGRIGDVLSEKGRLIEAMNHYLEGSHHDKVALALKAMTMPDLIVAPFGLLTRALEALPQERVRNDAALTQFSAWLASFRGDMPKAIEDFSNALSRFEAEGNAASVARCRKDLGLHRYLTGDTDGARQAMQELWGEPTADPFFPVEVAGHLILLNSMLGDFEQADDVRETMLRIVGAGPEAEFARTWLLLCNCMRLHLAGRFELAFVLSTQVVETFRSQRMDLVLPLALFQAALIAFYDGHHDVGAGLVDEGLRLAERMGIRDHQYAWLLYARALNSLGEPTHDHLAEDARRALAMFVSQGNTWGQVSVHELLAHECCLAGRFAEAERQLRTGLRLIEKRRLPVSESALYIRLSEVLAAVGKFEEARSVLVEHGAPIDLSTFHQYRANLVRAVISHHVGDAENMTSSSRAAVALAREYGYDRWLARDAGASPELFEGVRTDEALGDYLAKSAPAFGRSDTVALHPGEPLFITCLGSFSVTVGERVIADRDWRSSKALRIFQYLVIKGARGFVPIDSLLEWVWPEADPTVAKRRFHVALTTLRKVLEPGLRRGGRSSCYLARRHDAYRIEVGPGGQVDFVRFEQAVRTANEAVRTGNQEASLASLLHAVDLYRGPMLAESPFEESIRSEREALEQSFLATLLQLLRLYERNDDFENCALIAQRYLVHDPFAEPVYRRLMRYQARRGDQAAVKHVFARCETKLVQELGVGLSEDTLRLFRTLSRN